MKRFFLICGITLLTVLFPITMNAQTDGSVDIPDDELDYEAFTAISALIEANPDMMAESPQKYIDSYSVNVADSPDGKLRVFSFDLFSSGSMRLNANIFQYNNEGHFYNFYGSIERSATGEDNGKKISDGSWYTDVKQVERKDKNPIYLLFASGKIMSAIACSDVTACTFKDGALQTEDCFSGNFDEPGNKHILSVAYFMNSLSDRYHPISATPEALCYDEENRKIYLAERDEYDLTERYEVYTFYENEFADEFIYDGKDGGYWLYPPLRKFESLELFITTKSFQIRIDNLKNGSLRYACWKRNAPLSSKPDIILYDGETFYDESACYRFSNNGVFYEILNTGSYIVTLRVRQGDKVLLEQETIQ